MARTGKTAQEYIQNSFSPIIAVLCSSKVDNVVSKNNLSFTELLQPFTALDWEGQFREPSGSSCTIKNWRLIIRDVNWKPLQPTEARRQLNNAVLHNYNDKTVALELESHKFDVPQATHWFDAWRETYMEVQFPSDHEFTKHFLSCIIVGAAHEENIIDSFNALNQQYAQLQNVTPPKLPKWFNSGVLKTYLLIHDVTIMSKDRADAAFETLKQTFGTSNCFMLAINSKTNVDPILSADLWAPFIKRTSESNNEMSSSLSNLPTSPAETQPAFPPATVNVSAEDISAINPENMHPLTSTENDVYDNANSLQTHSFSGSVESVSVAGKVSDSTEVHGVALNSNDIDAIKKFLQEYAAKALLPYLEKQISQLSELVANRKGVSRSLLSATKRWFGTGKAGNTTGNSTVIYTSDCPELQLRRLGDLWFLCGQWQRAFDTYHTAKREFYADSAWLCYAGALEMAAISAFMAGDANRKTHGYMEESIVTYLNTCRMVQYAVRATLLSVLCLSSTGLHGEAAKQLIRMTSEDSDLRSAMLLEQAALCFLSGPGSKAMCRKYAFHMVLTGHRFSKAGQKKHAYRCYKQAYQVYADSGWRLSTDHVQFALGRLAGALRLGQEALRWLAAPLAPAPRAPQPPHQQDAFLREYMLAHQQWIENSEEFKERLPVLPLPLVEQRATSVLCVGPAPLSSPRRRPATSLSLSLPAADHRSDDKCWRMLEEALVQVARGSLPMIFKPTVDLYTEDTDADPIVPQGEPIQISITLWNPLKITLVLKDVELLWRFVPNVDDPNNQGELTLNNELALAAGHPLEGNVIFSQKISSVLLEGDCKKVLNFTLTPLRVGLLNINGLAYKLFNAGEGGNENGNRVMISGKVDLVSGVKSTDKRLNITVIQQAPCLQMTFSETSADIISGEMRTVDVEFTNVGPVDMKNLYVAVSHPDCISLVTPDAEVDDFAALYDEKYREPPDYPDERAARAAWSRRSAGRRSRLVARALGRGGGVRAALQLRVRASLPALHVLAYYETGCAERPYRLLRHVFRFTVTEAVELTVTPRRSLCASGGDALECMTLAIEVKNVFNKKDDDIVVEILEGSLLSRQWRLTEVTAARVENAQLNAHERLHLILKAKRILEIVPEGRVDYSSVKIAKKHSVSDISNLPFSKFIMDSRTPVDSTDTTDIPDIRSVSKKSDLIQSMFILRWKTHNKTSDKTAFGQHCLWLDSFTKVSSRENDYVAIDTSPLQLDEIDIKTDLIESNKNNKKDNVVTFRLEHSNHIIHNFKLTKLCLVPVTINIVNCYGIPVKVFIDMTKLKNRECAGELGWAGALNSMSDADSNKLGVSVNLDKFESRRIQVRGVCASPGTYVIGSAFTVSTTAELENINITNFTNNTSLLVVHSI